MATVDKNSQMNVKTSNGDIVKIYPNTKIANVEGLQTALNGKVDAVSGKGLSTNDYTTTEKNKLAGIASGAQVNSITGVKGNSESSYRTGNVNLTAANIGAAASSHTHNYAGSSSAGGAATSANKLNVGSSNIGSATQPVYFDASTGLPVATTYSLAKSVPSDAKFTDTTYSVATQSANGLMSSTDKTKLDGVATGANNYVHPTSSGNKHIPSGGSSGQILRWSADGTATWGADNNTWTAMVGATSSANGSVGYVNAVPPKDGYNTKYLRADGSWQVPPNTTYSNATTSANGLMSSIDKTKLDGIASGAQVNSITGVKGNSESSYRTGNVNLTAANIGAAASSHTHNYAGSSSAGGAATSANKLNVGSSNIGSATQPVYFNASTGLPVATTYSLAKSVPADAKFTDTTYSVATQSANGLMSSTDKTKLDGVATGANNYVHPTSSGNKHIPSGGSSGQILRWSADGTATWGADNNTWTAMVGATSSANGSVGYVNAVPPKDGYNTKYLRADGSWQVPPNTTYSVATQSANGLMSSSDKTKLDGIASGANKTTVDSALSSTSTNPVQNKIINSALVDVRSFDGTVASGSMNDLDSGCVLCTDGVTGGPVSSTYCFVRTRIYDVNCVWQQAIYPVSNTTYQRCKWAGTWGAWKQIV